MARYEPTPGEATLVAIDVAKSRNEVLIATPEQSRPRRLTVLNTRAEHDRLIEQLRRSGSRVVAAFEATGNYHRPLAWRLLEAGVEVRLISSVALARTREAIHNGWDKNDPKDAQVILHMLRTGLTQRYYDPLVHGLNDLQELSKTHEAISKAKTEVLHRLLTHYLPLYFPEIGRFRHNSRSEWFFAFLDRFPIPASITALGKEAFIAAAWDIVGRKVAKARLLADIYDTAASSIALPIPADAEAITMFRLVIGEAISLIRARDRIEARAQARLGNHPDYQRLMKIPGIGPIHALTILAEAGDLRRFGHHRQFLKFCGLDLATISPANTVARPGYRSSAMLDCVGPCGWRRRWRSGKRRTASVTSSSAMWLSIGATPIDSARRSARWPPRWRASFTWPRLPPLHRGGGAEWEDPFPAWAVRARLRPCRQ